MTRLDSEPTESPEPERTLAVTIHDVEPRTFRRVQEIRCWLTDRDINRVTLAVIPAADLHPVGTRSPMLSAWLRSRVARGDAIAQHGLQHRGGGPEFAHLGPEESLGRVRAGLAMLRDVELDPHGFIAPAYGYTPALRQVLAESFDWFGERSLVHGSASSLHAQALAFDASTAIGRLLTPWFTRVRVPFCGALLRLDIHPDDFALRRHIAVIERILAATAQRRVTTYDDLFCPRS